MHHPHAAAAARPAPPHPCPPRPACSARANNNAAEVLAACHYTRVAGEEEAKEADLKPLLREGPVKGAIAAVDAKP